MRKVVFSCINFSFGPNYHWDFHPKIQFQHTFALHSWRDRKNGDHSKNGICMHVYLNLQCTWANWCIHFLEPYTLIENYQSPNKNFDVELRETSMTSFPYPCLVSLILTRKYHSFMLVLLFEPDFYDRLLNFFSLCLESFHAWLTRPMQWCILKALQLKKAQLHMGIWTCNLHPIYRILAWMSTGAFCILYLLKRCEYIFFST